MANFTRLGCFQNQNEILMRRKLLHTICMHKSFKGRQRWRQLCRFSVWTKRNQAKKEKLQGRQNQTIFELLFWRQIAMFDSIAETYHASGFLLEQATFVH